MWVQVLSLLLTSGETLFLCISDRSDQAVGRQIRTPSHPISAGMHTLPYHSLLHDFPSLPRLKPERQRQVRALWLLASRQMSEQPPGFPYWSFSQAWLLTGGKVESWSGLVRTPHSPRAQALRRLPEVCPHFLLLWSLCLLPHLRI